MHGAVMLQGIAAFFLLRTSVSVEKTFFIFCRFQTLSDDRIRSVDSTSMDPVMIEAYLLVPLRSVTSCSSEFLRGATHG